MSNKNQNKNAVILRFSAKRGRPKSTRPSIDLGTPELTMKRALCETIETLDLCLEREIISKEQHWCGIHLRWLHTLRNGSPGVKAVDTTHIGGIDIKTDDTLWREEREAEYNQAIRALQKKGYALQIMNLCIYNERPKFLNQNRQIPATKARQAEKWLDDMRQGMDILVRLWKK